MFLKKELNLAIIVLIGACNHNQVFGWPQDYNEESQINNDLPNTNTTTASFSVNLVCGGKLSKLSNSDQLYDALLPRIIFGTDSEADVLIKKDFLKYLTLSDTFLDFIKCKIRDSPSSSHSSASSPGGVPHHQKKKFQEEEEDDEDGEDDGATGGIQRNQFTDALHILANGQRDPLDNSNVLIGVSRILANVFSGNIVGVVNESVGLRSPEGVQNTFVDVLSSIFGSNATAGVTGIIGNVTTTMSPHPQKELPSTTPDPLYKEFRQQQEYVQQLKEQGVLDQVQAISAHHQMLWNQQQSPDGVVGLIVAGGGSGADDETGGGEVDALNFQQKLLNLQRTKLQQRLQQLNLVQPGSTLLQQVQPQLILQRLQEQPTRLQLQQQLHPIQPQQPQTRPQPTYHPELLNHKPIHLLQQQYREPNRPQFQDKPVQPQFQQRKPIQPQQHFHRPQPIRHRPQPQQQHGYHQHQIHGLPRKDSSVATAALSSPSSIIDSTAETSTAATTASSDKSTPTSATTTTAAL